MALSCWPRPSAANPPGPPEQGRDPRAEVCPYRGLQPFREEDAPFFCGREAFTTTLLKRIATENLIIVIGASGSGKSSVVRAVGECSAKLVAGRPSCAISGPGP